MRIVLMIGMLLTMAGLFINAGRQTFFWIKLIYNNISPIIYGIIFSFTILAILASFIVSRIPNIGLPRAIFHIGHYALGFLFYFIILVNAASFLLLVGRLFHLIPLPMLHSVQLVFAAFSLLIAAGVTIYGSVHSANIRTIRYQLQLDQEQRGMDSLRIALISDIHLGYMIEESHLAKIVDTVNAIKPDIICISGDIFDGDMTAIKNPETLQSLFRQMKSTFGVYACLGNHDAGATYEQMLDFFSEADIRVLMDEAIVIDQRFILAGRKDSFPIGNQDNPRKPLELPQTKELPVIIMDHQPGNIEEYGSEADLVLCGHTHRGQLFPLNLITNAIFAVDYGYYRASDTSPHIIVTSGAGTWGPPQRVATDNEVVEIQLEFPK